MGFKRRYALPRGVSWDRSRGVYIAQIRRKSRNCNLGHFATVEEAAEAYRRANEQKQRARVPCGMLYDEQDVNLVLSHTWRINRDGYAVRTGMHDRVPGRRKTVFLHREIMQPPRDKEIDHMNRNRLDNRRANLRIVTRTQNAQNVRARSAVGYRGVSLQKASGLWRAQVKRLNHIHILGHYKTAAEAAIAARDGRSRLLEGALD